jgi:hypothetical protein
LFIWEFPEITLWKNTRNFGGIFVTTPLNKWLTAAANFLQKNRLKLEFEGFYLNLATDLFIKDVRGQRRLHSHVPAHRGARPGAKDHRHADNSLNVPDNPIIPFIEGDGIGIDITPVMQKVVDAAVAKAYGGKRKIHWMEIYAGEKSTRVYGGDVWLPDETLKALKEYVISIKGPMTTPVGGGIRSLNVALRQELDLYVCLRPVRYFQGVPSPLKDPTKTDMTIFRENTEDIYAGIEFEAAESTRLQTDRQLPAG